MVRVYGMNVSELPDPKEFPDIMELLPQERKEKIMRYLQAKDRRQSFGAGLLLHHVLFQHDFRMDEIFYGMHGKPQIKGICFNLSHSHDYAICAIGERSVGCDVEKIEHIRENIAERFFTRNEVCYLNQFENEEKDREFFRIWTMKESYMKMTGEGIQLGLNRCEFQIGDSVKMYRDGENCSCHIKEYDLNGYKVTVCAEENEFSDKIEFIKLEV